MRALGDVLDAAGWIVGGSDTDAESIRDWRPDVQQGHRAEAIDERLDLVVYSQAVPDANVELRRAHQLGLTALSYPQAVGRLMAARSGAAVAGTHGKSTTTAMAGEILAAAGLDPTVLCGAASVGKPSGGRLGRGPWMLAEACEYRASFHHLKPQIAVILGIEADHFDCFGTRAELEQAFAAFASLVPADGLVLGRADCAATQRSIEAVDCTSETFGVTPSATWRASELRERRGLYSFRIRCRERLVCDVKLHVPGLHNVHNALAAAALASHCGASGTAIGAGLERFAGLERRLQVVSEHDEIAIVDDYAHHPTAVTAALATVRQMYPARRVWCVFEPHQVSRTWHLLQEFAHSLQNADKIIVADIFRARESSEIDGDATAAELAARTAALGREAVHLASAFDIQDHLKHSLRPGDVLVTLGAGNITRVAHDLGKGFRTFRKAG